MALTHLGSRLRGNDGQGMVRKFAGVIGCAAALLLAGCLPSTRTVVVHHYTLGAPAPVAVNAGAASRPMPQTLKLARIDVPPWLAGTAMYYRLGYRNDNRLAAYGSSDWAAPPATLLEPLLADALAGSGHWQSVVGPDTPASTDVGLHLRLDDFSQAFAHPGESSGVLDVTATLIDGRNDRVIGQHHFHIAVPAASADAQGGAQALAQASRQLAAQLAQWLASIALPPSSATQP